MEKIVPFSEMRLAPDTFLDAVRDSAETIVLTRAGRPAGVLLDYEYYQGLLATIDEMNSPEAWEKLRRVRREMADGKWVPHEQVAARFGAQEASSSG